MSEESERESARCEFEARCQPNVEPTLTPEEVKGILNRSRRARLWAADRSLAIGEVIVASNGRKYVVTKAGVTGTSEPTWSTTTDAFVTDNTVTFQEAGTSYGIYDVSAAVREGLAAKLAKAAEYVNSEDGNETVIFANLQKLMEDYDVPMLA